VTTRRSYNGKKQVRVALYEVSTGQNNVLVISTEQIHWKRRKTILFTAVLSVNECCSFTQHYDIRDIFVCIISCENHGNDPNLKTSKKLFALYQRTRKYSTQQNCE
jgi:hypothetical protein